jgi:hypothetical protein
MPAAIVSAADQMRKNLIAVIAAEIIKQKNTYLHVGGFCNDCIEVDGSLDLGPIADTVITQRESF